MAEPLEGAVHDALNWSHELGKTLLAQVETLEHRLNTVLSDVDPAKGDAEKAVRAGTSYITNSLGEHNSVLHTVSDKLSAISHRLEI